MADATPLKPPAVIRRSRYGFLTLPNYSLIALFQQRSNRCAWRTASSGQDDLRVADLQPGR